ncbi:hypothetical protein JDV02_010181 [Purpureocillium takamizusanense]|nr:uncharacterized protein JDV02_010181 [Purpureocillium takamizusanense]UNI24438.1 hypothetical protein JDV02_010181 [Purpureocillium takamizusanense]
MEQIPVEIFDIIVSHLPRSDVRALRLVCKEFEAKVSASYFRNVVVPFKAEIYSSGDNAFSDGMRIFESFGPHFRRFALLLEVDEDALAAPPIKLTQRAVPAFWGIYRWPQENYCRYPDLEGIELAADETQAMAAALKCLSKVRNLGLCCDAGLGFLLGPDVVARRAFAAHGVFGTEDWRRKKALPSPMPSRCPIVAINTLGLSTGRSIPTDAAAIHNETLVRMVTAAGFSGPNQVHQAIRLMAATEGTAVELIELDGVPACAPPRPSDPDLVNDEPVSRLIESRASQREQFVPLIPSALSAAQTEMLLELDWAHRAMIQSYVIALMDNAATGVFDYVTTLSIAKIPSSHIKILCRGDLWRSLPQVKHVSLGVIADWREIGVSDDGRVLDKSSSPVNAVGKAFELLNSYIGRQPTIESIHFEWICGGEFGPSAHQRNQYILPAPFFRHPENMVKVDSPKANADDILRLPHAVHLSLKNCWVSPHVMLQALRQFALSSLKKLELESVSLSGPPTTTPQEALSWDLVQTGPFANGHLAQALAMQAAPAMGPAMHLLTMSDPDWVPPLVPVPNAGPLLAGDFLQKVASGILSWSGLIGYFSPDPGFWQRRRQDARLWDDNVEAMEAAGHPLLTYLPLNTLLRPSGKRNQLRVLSLKSCGYVSIDQTHIDTRSVVGSSWRDGLPKVKSNETPFPATHMQHCKDSLLGLITPHLPPQDRDNLQHGFGMIFGWEGVYDRRIIQDAKKDGIEKPGAGRFSGVVKCGPTARPYFQ